MSDLVTLPTVEADIKQRFGEMDKNAMTQQILSLVDAIGIQDDVDGLTPEQYQVAGQLLDLVYQQKANSYEEAMALLSNGQLNVSPQNSLQNAIDAHAALIVDELPIQVAEAKVEMQQGIRHALAERVAQKLQETDINARVEEIMRQQPKKPQPSFLEMLGMPPLPNRTEPKQLPGA